MKQVKEKTIYQQLGGKKAIDAAVEIFYDKVMADESINHFFVGTDWEMQKGKQKVFLAKAFGGAVKYTGKNLQDAHAHLVAKGLNQDHFDAVIGHLETTLIELKVPKDLRDAALEIAKGTQNDVLGKNVNKKEDKMTTSKSNGNGTAVYKNGNGSAKAKSKIAESSQNGQLDVLEALEQAVDAIVMIDSTKAVTFYNASAEKMFGYSREEV